MDEGKLRNEREGTRRTLDEGDVVVRLVWSVFKCLLVRTDISSSDSGRIGCQGPYSALLHAALTGLPPHTMSISGAPPDGVSLVITSNGTANACVQVSS